jgi:hypothetical protein
MPGVATIVLKRLILASMADSAPGHALTLIIHADRSLA